MRIGGRLGATLILFAATAAVLHLAPPVKGSVDPVSLYALPTTLDTWSSVEGAPDESLPIDPNERLSVRRTYRNGTLVAWVSVTLFAGQDHEIRRASINKLYPQRNVSLVEPVSFTLPLDGDAAGPTVVPTVVVHQGSRRLLVAYWHQIGHHVYGDEYHFRLALLRDVIFARRADSLLVRIAVPLTGDSPVRGGLDTTSELAILLYRAIAQEMPQ